MKILPTLPVEFWAIINEEFHSFYSIYLQANINRKIINITNIPGEIHETVLASPFKDRYNI